MTCKLLIGALTTIILLTGCQTETAPDAAAEPESATAQVAEEPLFEEAIEDAKCTLLKMEDVTAATGLPASAIEEEMSGCFYSWEGSNNRPEGTLYLSSVRVHDTLERAQRTHARKTQDVTTSDVGQAKEQVKDDLAEQRAEGEITSSEENLASTMTDAMPEGDFTHRALSGVGSEAAMDNWGSAYIRLGNVTIQFSGKTDGEDQLDPALAAEVGRRIVANLKTLNPGG